MDHLFDRKEVLIRIESLNKYFGDNWLESRTWNLSSEELKEEEKELLEAYHSSKGIYQDKTDPDSPVFS